MSDDMLTLDKLMAVMRRFPPPPRDSFAFTPFRYGGFDIIESPNMPTEDVVVGTWIVAAHPLAVWWCKLWGLSPWVNAGPIHERRPKAMGYMFGHRLFIAPEMARFICEVTS